MYGLESNQIGGYTQPNQRENYLEKVSRIWGPIFQRGARVLNTGINKISDPLMDKINEFQQSEAGQAASNLLEASTPGASLAFRGIDAAIDKFDLPQEAALLPLLGMLSTGKPPTKNQLKVLSKYHPRSPFAAKRGGSKVGHRSLINSDAKKLLKLYPDQAKEIDAWTRGAYDYARKSFAAGNVSAPLKGYPRFVTRDGKLFRPKPSGRFGEGYQLKFIDMDLLKGYGEARKLKEAPWLKQDVVNKLQSILESKGKGDRIDDLLKTMVKDYDKKLKAIPKNSTKGHFIPLKNGGLDVAENFGPQPGRNTYKIVDGKRQMQIGNYGEGAQSTVRGGVKPPENWEEYVNLKIKQKRW